MPLKGLLQIITGSEYRRDLLFYIGNSSKTLSEIKDYFEVTSPEIKPRIKEMEAANIIVKQDGAYELTLTGKILSSYYKPLLDTITAIESNCDFWESHDLSAIPEELLYRIQELKYCKVVKAENYNLFESHKEFKENVSSSLHFRGASCIFIPSWIELFTVLASEGAQIEIILTELIFNKIKKEYSSELRALLAGNTRLYVCTEPLNAAFATTDQYFSLALNTLNGNFYDHKNDLIGTDIASIRWGESLFEYYKERSIEIIPTKIKELFDYHEKMEIDQEVGN